MRKVHVSILLVICSLFIACEQRVKYKDKFGNQYEEIGDITYIIPAKYSKTGESFKIFLFNETKRPIAIINKFVLGPSESKTFMFIDTDTLKFDNGAKIYFGEYGLETEDRKSQIAGIGGEYWEKYKAPKDAEYGFVVVPQGKGDTPTK